MNSKRVRESEFEMKTNGPKLIKMEHIKMEREINSKSGESDKIINISILIQYIQSFSKSFYGSRCNKSCHLLTSFVPS